MTERVMFRSKVQQMGFAMLHHVLTLDHSLSDGAFRCYAMLLKYAQQKGTCWPGVERLSIDLNRGERTVARHLSELVERGLITRERRRSTSAITWIENLEHLYLTKMAGPDLPNLSGKEEESNKKHDDDNKAQAVERLFSSEIGPVTPGVRAKLVELLERYPDTWRWEAAFDGVILSGVRRLDYLITCLTNTDRPKPRPRPK